MTCMPVSQVTTRARLLGLTFGPDRSMERPEHQPLERRPTVPPGFHFTPTPEELIDSYLNPWIAGQPLDELEGIVCFADVYSRDPATLTKRFKNFCYDGHWYFCCVSRWKGAKPGGRVRRSVEGGGTWHNTFKRRPVREDGCCRLTFEYRDADDKKTGWLMEEFVSNLEEATDGTGVKVICKVYLSRRAPAPDEDERQATKVVGSKRPAAHREHGFLEAAVSNVAPSPAETGGAAVVGCSNAGTSQAALQPMFESMSKPVYHCAYGDVAVKREPDLELPMPMPLAMASANLAPALQRGHCFREAAVSKVAPSPADTGGAAVVGCSNAGTSQAAPMAWLQPMLESSMSKPIYYCGYGGAAVKGEPELPMPMPLAMASTNGEALQFAQTIGLELTVDVGREELARDEWLDRVLNFDDGAGDADDPSGDSAASIR